MRATEILEALKERAREDAELRGRLLAIARETSPIAAFCSTARELGYPQFSA